MTAFDILAALRALVSNALPGVDVRGFNEDATLPERLPADGVVLGDWGDPGEPDIDLSPVAYNYVHDVPVDIAVPVVAGDALLAQLLGQIGSAVSGNRTLGGRCNWLDVKAPTISTSESQNGAPIRVASFAFVADYTLANPLTG